MMRKGKAILAQPAALAPRTMASTRLPLLPRAPPALVRGAGEEAAYRARLRYRGLLQDYQELSKETEAKKRRLHMMRLMKRRLLAEVKFLRKRYKSMSENPSQTIVCRLRNPSVPLPPPTMRTAAWADDVEHRPVPAVGSSSKSMPVQRRQLGPPRGASPVIDLNESCEQGQEELAMGEYRGYRQPLGGINDAKRYPLEGDVAAGPGGVRMPVSWDIRNPAVRTGKRKISYQDQLVLGV